ncbi:hypothetical protein LCW13_10670 [Cobetia amphilecti]|uniref:hypothetical protein n=1 Tax=Cobetia amphilecti TaxID=1055104 RepID=UPI001CDA8137|nr:hypothetical protein [Cobetia amphilecti]UBU47527.1 hypothetical protein LCW13_10670 [Cobetia amphilecti]
MGQLIVHIGPPKTGTTTIQNSLFDSENSSFNLYNHFAISRQVNDLSLFRFFSKRFTCSDDEISVVEDFLLKLFIKQKGIISSEFFSSYSVDEWLGFKDYFYDRGFYITIVVYIRHPYYISISSIQEMLKKGRTLDDLMSPTLPVYYSSIFSRLAQVFENGAIVRRRFLEGSFDIYYDFISCLSSIIQEDINFPIESNKINRLNKSMSLDGAIFLSHYNSINGLKVPEKQIVDQAASISGPPLCIYDKYGFAFKENVNDQVAWILTNLSLNFEPLSNIPTYDSSYYLSIIERYY